MKSLYSKVLVLLSVSLVCSLGYHSSSEAQTTQQIETETVTTDNYLPTMDGFTTRGGTSDSCSTGSGATNCTDGTNSGGGFYTSTFDLEKQMTIDEINAGFDLDYGIDVMSHPSNTVLASCVDGNLLQASDCLDVFNLTVTLFDTGRTLVHKFEHSVELDYTGTRSFSFNQTIPENNFTSLTGEFELFGIDAGFPNGFFGPAFSNPTLTTTFELVTLLETEVIDILNTTDILDVNTPEDVEVATIEVEIETPDGQQMASLELEVNTEMSMEIEPLELPSVDTQSSPEVEVEVSEVSAELETEMSNAEPAVEEPVESAPEGGDEQSSETEPESEPETETAEAEPESEAEAEPEETNEPETETAEAEPETQTAENNQEENEESTDKPKVEKKDSAKQKAARKIVKKMGDKGRYDSTNQLKTLVIMNVLADTKNFLVQPTIPQPTGFFTDQKVPDAQLPENNAAAWMLMGGSNQLHDRLTGLQYKE
jgi:hypothetical protein